MFSTIMVSAPVIDDPVGRLITEIGCFISRLDKDAEAPERIGQCLTLLRAYGASEKAHNLHSQIVAMIENGIDAQPANG